MLDHDAATLVGAAAVAGFDAVGLRLSAEHGLATPGQVDEIRLMVEDLGISIHDVEVIRVDATWETAGRPPDIARALLETAAGIGATNILVVSDLPARQATSEAVAALVDEAAAFGLTIGLEYMAWTTPATPADALTMAVDTGCRVIVDVLHHHRVGAGTTELDLLAASDRLAWLQICDAADARVIDLDDFDRDGLIHEARHGRLPPGRGVLPLTELVAVTPAATAISVEVQSDELLGLDPEDRARLLATTTRALLGTEASGG